MPVIISQLHLSVLYIPRGPRLSESRQRAEIAGLSRPYICVWLTASILGPFQKLNKSNPVRSMVGRHRDDFRSVGSYLSLEFYFLERIESIYHITICWNGWLWNFTSSDALYLIGDLSSLLYSLWGIINFIMYFLMNSQDGGDLMALFEIVLLAKSHARCSDSLDIHVNSLWIFLDSYFHVQINFHQKTKTKMRYSVNVKLKCVFQNQSSTIISYQKFDT